MELDDQRLARRFAALTPEGRRGFLAKLQEAGLSFAELPIVPADRSGKLPISYAQRGLWLTWKLDPDSPAYNMPGMLRFGGALDIGALLTAVRHLVERHETLRAIFRVDYDDEPHQVILPPDVVKTEVVDLCRLPEQERTQELRRLQQGFARTPFRLDAEPPLRARLWKLGDDEHVLGIVLHHIAGDGVSVRILIDELLLYYQCECGLRTERLEPLRVQFADYVVWQRNWFDAGEKERQLAYWQARLGREHPPLDLSFARPRGVLHSRKESHHGFSLPADLSDGLRVLARDHGASLFMVMLALFKLLLCRFSGQTYVRVGAPIANRQRPETRGMVAYLTNMLVLRTQVELSGTFADLLGAVRETVLEAHAHPDLPFDLLVEALQPERHTGVHPLFQVKCTQQDDISTVWRFPGLEIEADGLSTGDAHFDLSLDFVDGSDHIEAVFAYSKDLFEEAIIARFARAIHALAGYVVKAPGAPLRCADFGEPFAQLEGESRSFIDTDVLNLWNESVRRFPDRSAVRCDDRAYSYADLDTHADQLAAELMAHGVGSEARVGIHAERSCEFALGVLAALKAGAAYVPLDPQLPPQRLAYQADDSGVQVLLSTQAPGWQVSVPLIELAFGTAPSRKTLPPIEPHPARAAYVIYTSGSTGQPKGVVISRGALANYVQAVLERVDLPADASQVAMVSTVAADLGHTSFFGALCSGRTLHLIPAERVFDPDAFAEYMSRHRVDALKIVPSHLQALLNAAGPADVLPASRLVMGGEATRWPLLERIATLKPGCRVLNHYGPTETTVGILTQEAGDALRTAGTLPVGKPLANSSAHVLDADLNPVPVGVVGELYLGGAGVARGYQARAAQTSERFVANPFSAAERLYRTGDRVKMLEDGSLEFLGRVDDQVKVRGYRVELREVVQALQGQLGIAEAEVVAREDEDGRTQLYGYVVAQAGERIDIDGLREALARMLPEYMVPPAIMQLDALPLTANGKVDRKALPEPEEREAKRYEAPRDEVERALAEVWEQVLRVDRVGRHDNFFELGGDSILTLQIVARARKRGVKFRPKQLMELQTIAAIGAAVALEGAAVADGPVATNREAPDEAFALTPIQRWFFEQRFDEAHHWNQSLMMAPTEVLEPTRLRQAVEHVVAHHEALRLRFSAPETGPWRQAYGPAHGLVGFERIDLAGELQASSAVARAADAAQRSLSMDQPFNAVWIDLGPGRPGRLLLVAHHLVVDGVSWRLIVEDLQTAYRQLGTGSPVELPARTTSFRAWSEALAGYARRDAVKAELPYWQSVVGEKEPSLPGWAAGSNLVGDARTIETVLGEDRTEQLLIEVPQAYRTQINDILLTALARTLCEWDGRESVLVELEGHGREEFADDIDLSRTVGWFTTLFPVRLTPGRDDRGASIKAIKELLRQVPNKGLGYGVLRYLTEEGRVLGEGAYPQVTFNYLGQFDQTFDADSMWRVARESTGLQRSPLGKRRTWLDVGAVMHKGELRVSWTYSAGIHDEATVQRLARRYHEELEALIAHCTDGAVGVTPADFPLARLTQSQLDHLPMPPENLADLYPLSSMQLGMLFHSVYDDTGTIYVNQLRADVEGLDPARFRAAWQVVFERHEVLRTGFLQGEKPLQWVARSVEVPLEEHDWRERADLPQALEALAQAELARGFDLVAPPLMRLALVRTSATRHHLIWTRHHLLLDGWSSSRLMAEILSLYSGQPTSPPRGRFRDHIAWLQGRDTAASANYWDTLLASLAEPTRLAAAVKPAEKGQGYRKHRQPFSAEESARLASFARAERVTVNTLIQAAWALLLQRYTGQDVVCFGATTAGRSAELPGAEQILGLFINTVPVIAAPQPQHGIGQWLRELLAQNLASREHEHTPLFEIQRRAGVGGQGLFDTIVVFENYPVDEALRRADDGQPRFEIGQIRDETNYPMSVMVHHGQSLVVDYAFQGQSFSHDQVERLAAHVRELLLSLTDPSNGRLGDLAFVSEAERQELNRWGVNERRYVEVEPVHRLIERRARARPAATALVFGEEALSYAELNGRANRLAHRLIALGVKPEAKVGIAVERSIEMVVGLLAILKAGGAYVPLDPEYPAERLAYMMADSGIGLLLTQSHVEAHLPTTDEVRVLELDALDLSGEPAHDAQVAVHGESLAYVIYTSGSTGRPKGAANRHCALYNRLAWMQDAYRLDESDTVLQKTPFSFDVSVWEFFWPLMVGARLAVAGPGDHRDPGRLIDLIRGHQVTTLHFVPSMLQAFLAHEGIEACISVRRIVCSGEALPAEAQNVVFERLPQAALYNLYGPTEAAIDVTHWTCRDDGQSLVPIGQPISGIKTYVLDGGLNLAPQGVAGELYLGGIGLARGYLGRAGLSAERFVADPFDEAAGRLYRTGDLVRWNGEAQLEYLGRLDHQVKIRGLRIELGEVEAQLLAQPEVREAVVVAKDGPGGARLVGYVSASAGQTIDAASLRERLGGQLPDYMVPSVIVVLESLPLNANGKVDRKALPAPEFANRAQYEPPQGDVEETLAAIWAEVLRVERVGRHDNFFELGGHSLLAVQIVARIQTSLRSDLTIRRVFSHPTLTSMASLIEGESRAQSTSSLAEIDAFIDNLEAV